MTEPFRVTDRRASRLVTGETVSSARAAVGGGLPTGGRMPREGIPVPSYEDPSPGVRRSSTTATPRDDSDAARQARLRRRISGRQRLGSSSGAAGVGGGGGGGVSFATGRPRDPMFYWRQNNIPYDFTKEDELRKVREFCRLLYVTHPIVAACVDIFSKFPLQGMRFSCKDKQLEDFHGELFFDQLNYEDYLLDVGREYWLTGEAWPLGSFNEVLGVWDDDELLNPDDVEVERSPLIKDPRFLIRLPETLRKVITERSPRWEFEKLMQDYPELSAFSSQDALMPVSNILLKQLKFKGDTFHKRGIPILLRGFRSVMQEEMLMAAMDAVADRLYTPLILAKLGASASDLGTDTPWIPTEEDLGNFEESLDAALAADFRVLTHNFALDMAPVFGRENMPDMTNDFTRIEDRILQVFGLSRTMLQGADSGETYAADALNRDVVAQLLSHYQRTIRKFWEDRAYVVAEAQEHYDYDVRQGKRYVKMEEILEYDENGEPRIVEQPKLLIPDLEFDTMSLTDENVERQFIESLVDKGVPIPYKRRLMGTGIDWEEALETRSQEQIDLARADQQTRRQTFTTLRNEGLPIPQDLLTDFQPKAAQAQTPADTEGVALPALGVNPPGNAAIAPTPDDLMAEEEEGDGAAPDGASDPMAATIPMEDPEGTTRPPESDEQRGSMPKPPPKAASRHDDAEPYKVPSQIRTAAARHHEPPKVYTVDGEEGSDLAPPHHQLPRGRFGSPRHVGMRRHVEVPESERLPEDDETT
jgi:hypothetical protein